MDKESHNISSVRDRDKIGGGGGGGSLLLRASSDTIRQTTSSELVLQWGNRKRPRCMKVQVKVDDSSNPVQRTTVRSVDRRVVRTDPTTSVINNNNHSRNHHHNNTTTATTNQSNGYPNLRQRPASPQQPLHHQRVLRILCGSGCGIIFMSATKFRARGANDYMR